MSTSENAKTPVILGPLSGPDGNAWAIMAACKRALRKEGRLDEWNPIQKDMMSGDYQHLLDVVDNHFTVLGTRLGADSNWRST